MIYAKYMCEVTPNRSKQVLPSLLLVQATELGAAKYSGRFR